MVAPAAVPAAAGAIVRTDARDDVPAVVAACVRAGASVFGVDPRDPTLEDVYFAIEARAAGGPTGLSGAEPDTSESAAVRAPAPNGAFAASTDGEPLVGAAPEER